MNEILNVTNLSTSYGKVRVLRDISFSLRKNEILGVVGESGCGKSTLIKSIAMLKGLNCTVTSGDIVFDGRSLLSIGEEERRKLWGDEITMIFQNPESCFNHSRRIGTHFTETVKAHRNLSDSEIFAQTEEIFKKIGLKDTKRILNSYPFELSGGMNQRVAIALAVLLKPKLILADEPTSALDTTVQKQVVEEMLALKESMETSMIVITHNIGVVGRMADNIAVMYGGRIIEYGRREKILEDPQHPYTKALLSAVPKLGAGRPVSLKGRPPKFESLGDGCAFLDRCCECEDGCRGYKNLHYHYDDGGYVLCWKEDCHG